MKVTLRVSETVESREGVTYDLSGGMDIPAADLADAMTLAELHMLDTMLDTFKGVIDNALYEKRRAAARESLRSEGILP